MLFFSKHHRYFVVEGPPLNLEELGELVLKTSGEFGLGRMSPQIRFHDRVAEISVLRVSRESAPDVFTLNLKILKVFGSMRTCRQYLATYLLRERYPKENESGSENLERSLARLRRVRN